MEIWIGSLLDGAAQATGAVAIIDVFRAFTTAAVVLANGASQITMVSTVEEALALRESGLADICMGEVGGRAPAGFDFGNSPFEVSNVDFTGKSIVQRTSAGTQGIVAARHAERLYATSRDTEADVTKARDGIPERDCRWRCSRVSTISSLEKSKISQFSISTLNPARMSIPLAPRHGGRATDAEVAQDDHIG